VFHSEGAGTSLGLTGLTGVNFSGNGYMQMEAFSGGTVDVHNLKTITGSSGISTPLRLLADGAGSTLNFSGLSNIPSGMVSIDLRNGATLLWGNPTTFNGGVISRTGATTLNVSALSNIDGTSLNAFGGAVVTYPAVTAYAPAAGNSFHAD